MSNPPVLRLGGHGPVRNAPSLVATRADMALVSQLVDMGFTVEKASQALIQTDNKIGAALDWLDANSTWEVPASVINQSLMEVQPGYNSERIAQPDMFIDAQQRQNLGTSMPGQEPTQRAPANDAVAVATLAASEPAADIHSRYESNSKDAYRERKRQKEIEKARLEKLQQQEEAARLKAEVAAERARRAGLTTEPSSVMQGIEETSTKNELAAFEERKRQKEAEEERKRKAAAALEKERVLKEIAEEKERKFGAEASQEAPKLTPAEQKAAYEAKQKEKAKEAWKAEQEANQRRLAELRRQLQEDKERKAALRAASTASSSTSTQASTAPVTVSTAKATSPSSTASSTQRTTSVSSDSTEAIDSNAPVKSVAEQLAEARRARLGITKVTGRQAHAGNASFNDDDDDDETDIDKIKARNKAKAAAAAAAAAASSETTSSPPPSASPEPTPTQETTMHDSLRDMHQKKFEAQRKKEQEEAERRARAERASRMIANTASLASRQPTAAPSTVQEPEEEIRLETSHPEIPEEPTMISLRLPDGRIKKAAFKASDPVSAVHKYAASWLPLESIFSLLIPMPRREFSAESGMEISLREAGLSPRGLLTVLTLQNRGTVRQAPPRPAHLARIMHMMNYGGNEMEATEEYANMSYEELLELQERMGFVPTGLNNREISALPSSKYVPTDDGAFCVICQLDIEEGETVTTLPNCKHVFHKDHVEQWLKDNRSCPACRQRVVVGRVVPPSEDGESHSPEGSADEGEE